MTAPGNQRRLLLIVAALLAFLALLMPGQALAKGGGGGGGGRAGGGFSGSHVSSGFGSSGGSHGGGYSFSSSTRTSTSSTTSAPRTTTSGGSSGGGTVFIPVPIGGGYRPPVSAGAAVTLGEVNPGVSPGPPAWVFALLVLLALALIAAALAFFLLHRKAQSLRGLGKGALTVAQIDVMLLGSASNVPAELHRLADSIDTASQVGYARLLSQTALLLLREHAFWASAASVQKSVRFDRAEEDYRKLTIAARARMPFETYSNVDGDTERRAKPDGVTLRDDDVGANIVVTLTLAIHGDLPRFESMTDEWLNTALETLAALPPLQVEAAEVAWLPDEGQPPLTQDDLLTDFPTLVPV